MTDIQRQTLKCGLVGRDFKKVIFFLKKRGRNWSQDRGGEDVWLEAEHKNY